MDYKLLAILLSTMMLLAACSQAPAGAGADSSSPDKQTPPAQQPAKPVVDHSAKPAAPTETTSVAGAGNCYVTPEAIKTACNKQTLPVLKEGGNAGTAAGCVFEVPAGTDGVIETGGEVTLSVKSKATLSDYETEISQYAFEEETYELKPRATRIEANPFTYFFWFTGNELVSLQAHKTACTSDGLKKIAVEIGTVLDE